MAEDCIDLTEDTEFQTEFETNLIQAVKQQHCIYVKHHPQYENKLHNDIAWLRITKSLKRTTIECMNKWYSLLQTFLYFSKLESKGDKAADALKWPHYKTLKEMRPDMVESYVELLKTGYNGKVYPKITKAQEDDLLNLMKVHSKELMSVFVSNTQRQEIWTNIANKLNATKNGVPLPVIRWQKVWWDLKQAVGLRKRLEMKGINVSKDGDFDTKDLRILKICDISPMDEEHIKAGMDSYIEFDIDTDDLMCEQCVTLQRQNNTKDLCKKCSKTDVGTCDVCLSAPLSSSCDTTHWSSTAKEMIPLAYRNKSNLSLCQVCHSTLKRKASLAWKICRICAKESHQLENLLNNSFKNVREDFRRATKFTFCLTDGLPCFACPTCLDELLEFTRFYVKFNSAQVLLQEIHNNNFIGKDLENTSPQKEFNKISNKRSKPSQETSIADEEISAKRIRLSEVIVSALQQGTSPLTDSIQDTPQKLKHRVSNSRNRMCSIEDNKPNTPQNSTAGLTKKLKQNMPSEVGASVPWTTCIAVQPNSPLNSSTSAHIVSGSRIETVSKLVPNPSTTIPNLNFNQSSAAECDKINLHKSLGISITKKPNLNQPNVAVPEADLSASLSSQTLSASSSKKKSWNLNQLIVEVSSPPQIKPGTLKITSLTIQNTPPILPVSKEKQPKPPPTLPLIQQTPKPMTFIPSSSPLNKSTMNPMLQVLLDRPQLEVTASPVGHFSSIKMPKSSSFQTALSSSAGQFLEIKKSTKSNEESLSSSITKKISGKPPARRKTIHNLSPLKPFGRPRQASLEGEIIVIRDDTPPRESPHKPKAIEVDLGSAIPNLNSLWFSQDSVNLEETLLETEIAVNKSLKADDVSQQRKANTVNDESLEFISPSFLIDFAVNKAFRRYTQSPQRINQQTIESSSMNYFIERSSKKVPHSKTTPSNNQEHKKDGKTVIAGKNDNILEKSKPDNNPTHSQEQGNGIKRSRGRPRKNSLLEKNAKSLLENLEPRKNSERILRARKPTNETDNIFLDLSEAVP